MKNNFKFKLFNLLVLTVISFSCNDPEPEFPVEQVFIKNPSFKLDGKYDVTKFEATKPVDLDMDGIFSSDILNEANKWKDSNEYFVHFFTERDDHDTTLYVPKLFVYAPLVSITVDEKANYLSTRYGLAGLLARFYYTEKDNRIALKGGDSNRYGRILDAKVVNEGLIVIQLAQYYYTSSGWEELRINATYKKRN